MPAVKSVPPPNRRQAQADATRAAIVAAAQALFMRDGYAAATIEAIAREAGVAMQTVYNAVGKKPALLNAVLDAAASGPAAPRPVAEFMQERAAASADGSAFIALLADWFAEVQPRIAPVFRLIDEAAADHPEVAALAQARAEQRLRNYAQAARALKARNALAEGYTLEEAAALVWSIGHPQVYRMLVTQQGWTLVHYRNWVQKALLSALLPPMQRPAQVKVRRPA